MVSEVSEASGTDPIRVLVVDDHRSFSEALSMAIDLQGDLECIGIAATLDEALEAVERDPPDVILMDVHLPDADGVEGTERVRALNPGVSVVILTADTNPTTMARAAAAGASGFLVKAGPMKEVLEGIRTAREGGMLLRGTTLASILEQLHGDKTEPRPTGRGQLTSREIEVLNLLGSGSDPAAIARDLGISIHTARGHVKSILAKLGAHSQLEAVVVATRMGLLPAYPS